MIEQLTRPREAGARPRVEPSWLAEARKWIGLTEIKGGEHAPEILQMWRDIKRGGIRDDETPWCAAFVGAMLERVGVRSTRFESARSMMLQSGRSVTPRSAKLCGASDTIAFRIAR